MIRIKFKAQYTFLTVSKQYIKYLFHLFNFRVDIKLSSYQTIFSNIPHIYEESFIIHLV